MAVTARLGGARPAAKTGLTEGLVDADMYLAGERGVGVGARPTF